MCVCVCVCVEIEDIKWGGVGLFRGGQEERCDDAI